MTEAHRATGAPSGNLSTWDSVNWVTAGRNVRRLQMRIAKAVREGDLGKARSLQWLLTHSWSAKLVAVKRVVSNKGSRTPGIDQVIWSTPKAKMQAVMSIRRRGYRAKPLRRLYIPKKNGSKRPLSIPTMDDRAQQALHKLALEPIAETLADPNSYGFRKNRCCADAIEQCFKCLSQRHSARWVLEGDIKSFYDEIAHQWILANIPMDRQVLQQWATAGYVEKGKQYPTYKGTPQGGIISPTIANMVLDGLEETARRAAPYRSRVNVIRYADDFVITGKSRELLQERIQPAIERFLKERGVSLATQKTRITHIADGFDFLGQTIRAYSGKVLIRPSRMSKHAFLVTLKDIIKKHDGRKASDMIESLNAKLRGWGNYHRHSASNRAFKYIDTQLYHYLWRWIRRRHPKKNAQWLIRKYWSKGSRHWRFAVRGASAKRSKLFEVMHLSDIPIVRHVKLRALATPFDPEYTAYLFIRRNCAKAGSFRRRAKR